MLSHHFYGSAPERKPARQHLPKGHAKRVEVRSDINRESRKLFRARIFWGPSKSPKRRNRGLSARLIKRLGKAEVDDFGAHRACLLQAHHNVGWFNIPMNELLPVNRD